MKRIIFFLTVLIFLTNLNKSFCQGKESNPFQNVYDKLFAIENDQDFAAAVLRELDIRSYSYILLHLEKAKTLDHLVDRLISIKGTSVGVSANAVSALKIIDAMTDALLFDVMLDRPDGARVAHIARVDLKLTVKLREFEQGRKILPVNVFAEKFAYFFNRKASVEVLYAYLFAMPPDLLDNFWRLKLFGIRRTDGSRLELQVALPNVALSERFVTFADVMFAAMEDNLISDDFRHFMATFNVMVFNRLDILHAVKLEDLQHRDTYDLMNEVRLLKTSFHK